MDFHGPQGMKSGADPKNLQTSKLAKILMDLSALNLDAHLFTHIINKDYRIAGRNFV